ncbi:hypothetical protein U1Q18_041243 [Sarracenia purpurea var. burkii]
MERISYWILFALLRPFVRLIVSFVYCFFCFRLFRSWHMEPLNWLLFTFDSLESSSSWTEDSFEINVLLEPFPAEETALSNYRAQNAHVEAELFSGIQALEAQLAHGIPPQLNPGEYENLVRDNLANSINLNHYRSSLSNPIPFHRDAKTMMMAQETKGVITSSEGGREDWKAGIGLSVPLLTLPVRKLVHSAYWAKAFRNRPSIERKPGKSLSVPRAESDPKEKEHKVKGPKKGRLLELLAFVFAFFSFWGMLYSNIGFPIGFLASAGDEDRAPSLENRASLTAPKREERGAKPSSPTTRLLLFYLAASPIVIPFLVNGFPMLLFSFSAYLDS